MAFALNSMHVKSIVKRVSPRINILKAIAGTNWGQQNETIFIAYMCPLSDPYSCMIPKRISILLGGICWFGPL